jgi:hypothetical protein
MSWSVVLSTIAAVQRRRGIGRPHLEKLIVGRGLGELLAVLDGLLELGGLGDHVCG